MRIGLSSLIGDGFGSGAFVFGEVLGVAPSFPPYGTFIETLYGIEVPISAGGGYVTYNSTEYPNQRAEVDSLADGAGGSFLDWANRRDTYLKNGETFLTETTYSPEIVIDGTSYGYGCTYVNDLVHDGDGGYSSVSVSGGCSNYGTYITSGGSGENQISTPVGMWTYQAWDSINYYHDGLGGFYGEPNYTFNASVDDYIGTDNTPGNSSTEVPSWSGNYFSYETWDGVNYYYDGSGGYYSTYIYTYVAISGDFITNDGSYDYYWDGTGGYYT